jgi:hypothetical protein
MSLNDETLLNIVTTGETLVKTGRGRLNSICLNSAITSAMTVYDSTSNSGTKIGTLADNSPAGTYLMYGGRVMNGIYITSDDAVHSHSTLTSNASAPTAGKKVTIGTTVYTWRATCTAPYDVKIGTAAVSLDNLKLAINAGTLSAGEYGAGTVAHPGVTATDNADTTQKVEAKVAGVAGDAIATTTDDASLGWTSTVLASGSEGPAFDLTVSYS